MTKRILIVDDEEDIRDVLQASLEEFAGWLTVLAASGMEGMQLAQSNDLDAILLDISMPDMDGFELCKILQSEPKTKEIPIIVLTARALLSDRQRFSELAAAGVITKPFDPMTIWMQIIEILGWSM